MITEVTRIPYRQFVVDTQSEQEAFVAGLSTGLGEEDLDVGVDILTETCVSGRLKISVFKTKSEEK